MFMTFFLAACVLLTPTVAFSEDQDCCKIHTKILQGTSENNNVDIVYLTAGNKKNPAVFLIHGNGATADGWRGVIKKMCKDFYLIAPYRRGTLPSGQPDTGNMLVDYSLEVTTTDFRLILQQEDVQNPHIIAHSYSGRFAELYYFTYQNDPILAPRTITLLATSFSHSIAGPGLVCVNNAIGMGDQIGIATCFSEYAVTVSCEQPNVPSPELYKKLQAEVFNLAMQTSTYAYQSYTAVAGQASSNFIPAFTPPINIPTIPYTGPTIVNPTGSLAEITIPVYIVGGDQDEINLPIDLSILSVCLPNHFIEELRGVPHFSFLTNYKVLAKKFTDFIQHKNECCSFLLD